MRGSDLLICVAEFRWEPNGEPKRAGGRLEGRRIALDVATIAAAGCAKHLAIV